MTDAAPANRQFVAVAFRPGDQRTYTYHNDGEPVAIGDRVIIPSRSGGEQVVTVSDIPPSCFVPKFETKPIVGKAPPQGDAPADDAPAPASINSSPLPF